MNLIASLIVRNELGRYLGPCIEALLDFCDEIRVLDDGSTDGWYETLAPTWGRQRAKVKVHRHEVAGRESYQDFHLHAAARNRLLKFTLEGDPGYVLAIDADEFVTDGAAVRRECENGSDVLSLEIVEVWQACDEVLCSREDGGWRGHEIGCVWRADRFKGAVLMLADKKTATGRVPDVVHRVPARPTGEGQLHFGWANQAERAERFKRYDTAGDGHSSAHVHSIMWPDERVQLRPRDWPPSWPSGLREAIHERANRG